MKLASVVTVVLAGFSAIHNTVKAHSWLECTDYRMTEGTASAKVWDPSLCKGRARCGAQQADAGFGVDTGFNYHSKQGCQCARGSNNYDALAIKAVYKPGQRVCLAYPSKNHVAASCSNPFVPDTGVIIRRTAAGSTSDDTFARDYQHGNGQHQSGVIDYKGFQNCPNFCESMDRALCTMCFQLENDITPGEYTFKWIWEFTSTEDAYSTCWEATVNVTGGNNPTPTPALSKVPSPSQSPLASLKPPSSSSPAPKPSRSSNAPSPAPSHSAATPSLSPTSPPNHTPKPDPHPTSKPPATPHPKQTRKPRHHSEDGQNVKE